MELAAAKYFRRAKRDFPSLDERIFGGERKKNVGGDYVVVENVVDVAVIEKIVCAGAKRIEIERPTLVGHVDADLKFGVAFAGNRNELLRIRAAAGSIDNGEQRSGDA